MRNLFNSLFAHAGNDHSPTLLQKTAMAGMGCLVILTFVMSSLHTLLWQHSAWLVGAVLPAVVTTLTNNERAEYAAPALQRNALLDEAARMKAEHMAAEGYFAHYSPGGVSPWFWFQRVGYTYAHAGENLAVHFSDSAAVVDAWMNSPTHKANIVNDVYTEIGIGVARGRHEGFDTVFVVQLFGTPAQTGNLAMNTAPLDVLPEERRLITNEELVTSDVLTEQSVVAGAGNRDAVALEEASTLATLELPNEPFVTEESLSYEATEPSSSTVTAEEPDRTIAVYEGYGQSEASFELAHQDTSSLLQQAESSQFLQLSTSSGLSPVPITNELVSAGTSAPLMAQLATQPSAWLRYVYIAIGTFVIISLLTSVVIGWRRHRPLEIAYGAALLSVMAGCYYLHTALTSGVMII